MAPLSSITAGVPFESTLTPQVEPEASVMLAPELSVKVWPEVPVTFKQGLAALDLPASARAEIWTVLTPKIFAKKVGFCSVTKAST